MMSIRSINSGKHCNVLSRILRKVVSPTSRLKEMLALSASDRMAACKDRATRIQGLQSLEGRVLLSGDPLVAVDDAGSINEQANSVTSTIVTGTSVFGNDSHDPGATLSINNVNSFTPADGETEIEVYGQYGVANFDVNTGGYTYELFEDLPQIQALNDGETVTETFNSVVIFDGTNYDVSQLDITINGATDQPPTTDLVSVNERANSVDDTILTGNLQSNDPADYGSGTIVEINGQTEAMNEIDVYGAYGRLTVDITTGDYSYTLFEGMTEIQNLNDGETLLDIFSVTTQNVFGIRGNSYLDVTINGATDQPPTTDLVSINERANSVDDTILTGNLQSNDPADYGSGTIVEINGQTEAMNEIDVYGAYGRLTVDITTGDYSYTLFEGMTEIQNLNDGETLLDIFSVTTQNVFGIRGNSYLDVTINGATDQPPTTDLVSVNERANSVDDTILTGNLQSNDPADYGSGTIVEINGQTEAMNEIDVYGAYGRLTVDITTGDYSYTLFEGMTEIQNLNDGETLLDIFSVTTQNVFGIRGNSYLDVTINGATDQPPTTDLVSINERANSVDDTILTGNLQSNDPADYGSGTIVEINGQTEAMNEIDVYGAYGRLTVDITTGDYSYTLFEGMTELQNLNDGETLLDIFSVTTQNVFGIRGNSYLDVTINGATDQPPTTDLVSINERANSVDDTILTGNLQSNDPADYGSGTIVEINGQTEAMNEIDVYGAYGRLTVDITTGDYSYTLFEGMTELQNLNDGETLLDIFSVTTQNVFGIRGNSYLDVTINGATDQPPTNDNVSVDKTEADVTGNLQSNDPADFAVGVIQSVNGHTEVMNEIIAHGNYGQLNVDITTGDFTYTLNIGQPEIDNLGEGESLVDVFTVVTRNTFGIDKSSVMQVTIDGVAEATSMGETGSVWIDEDPVSVTFTGTYVNPVVFASSTLNDPSPVAVRINNLTSTGFDVELARPSNVADFSSETVYYYVFEAGVWELEDGTIVEIGTRHSSNLDNNNKDSVNFKHDFDTANLTVLTHIQTNNNQGWFHARHGNIDASGFDYLIQTEEVSTASSLPASEVVGYLAIESGSGTWSGSQVFDAIHTARDVKQNWSTVNYAQTFASTPSVVSTLGSLYGLDDSNTSIRNLTSSSVDVRVVEDTTKDSETNHTKEEIDLLAIESGVQLSAKFVESSATTMGQTGSVDFQDSTSVTINQVFVNPVVFASVSSNGSDPVVVRVDNLQVDSQAGTTSFDLLLAETSNSTSGTAVETVNYFVMESGVWELADGTKLVVGTLTTSQTTLKSNKTFDTVNTAVSINNPALITQVQTNNNAGWVSVRVKNKTAGSFQVALEPEENSQVAFSNAEKIGYMMIEGGTNSWDGMAFTAGATSNSVTHNNYALNLDGLSAASAYGVGSLSTYDGADPSRIRFTNDLTNILVNVEEDTTKDSEVNHTSEVVDYFIFTNIQALTAFGIA